MNTKEILAKISAVFAGTIITSVSTDMSGHEIELDLAGFIQLITIVEPPVLFLSLKKADPDLYLSKKLMKDIDSEEDEEMVLQRFVSEQEKVVEKFRRVAGEAIATEIFLIKEGACFVYYDVPDEVLDLEVAIDVFLEKINEISAAKEDQRSREEEDIMTRLVDRLTDDEGFKGLHGLRKRCVYIQRKYGSEVPISGYLERPDKGSDLIEANVVRLARRASDILEASKY